jgi:YfiH family protein
MNITKNQDLYFIKDVFPAGIMAGFSGPSLKGAIPADVRKIIFDLKGAREAAYLKQTHLSDVCEVSRGGYYTGDGLMTCSAGLVLFIKTADCLPLLLYSPDKKAVAAVHMGWRSAVSGILGNLPKDLAGWLVFAGVGMRQCCYQVTEEFLEHKDVRSSLVKREEKLYFDPVSHARDVLTARGLGKNNFFDCGMCSVCHPERFFSWRREKAQERTLTFIVKTDIL